MRKTLMLYLALFAVIAWLTPGTQVQAEQLLQNQAAASVLPAEPLCIPAAGEPNEDCQSLGPAAYLDRISDQGLTLPRNPLPAAFVDLSFAALPYNYVRLSDRETPIYTSIEDARAQQNEYRTIPAGFNFVTYETYFEGTGGARNYMIEPGMWIRGGNTSGRVTPSEFRGLVFSGTPANKFGWILYETTVQTKPGLKDTEVLNEKLYRFEMIQVYQTKEEDEITWLMIGPDEWIDRKNAALVYPASAAPAGVENGRWIEINLYEQTLAVYQDNRMVFATLTSTGIPGWWTRPGLFQIYDKLESTPMSGAFEADRSDYYYLEDVPWTMYFDEARALHGAYWHNYFGYEQSHGCVNLSPADSQWLYLWGNIGDYVYVWDPSGETPTDPALYTAGGA